MIERSEKLIDGQGLEELLGSLRDVVDARILDAYNAAIKKTKEGDSALRVLINNEEYARIQADKLVPGRVKDELSKVMPDIDAKFDEVYDTLAEYVEAAEMPTYLAPYLTKAEFESEELGLSERIMEIEENYQNTIIESEDIIWGEENNDGLPLLISEGAKERIADKAVNAVAPAISSIMEKADNSVIPFDAYFNLAQTLNQNVLPSLNIIETAPESIPAGSTLVYVKYSYGQGAFFLDATPQAGIFDAILYAEWEEDKTQGIVSSRVINKCLKTALFLCGKDFYRDSTGHLLKKVTDISGILKALEEKQPCIVPSYDIEFSDEEDEGNQLVLTDNVKDDIEKGLKHAPVYFKSAMFYDLYPDYTAPVFSVDKLVLEYGHAVANQFRYLPPDLYFESGVSNPLKIQLAQYIDNILYTNMRYPSTPLVATSQSTLIVMRIKRISVEEGKITFQPIPDGWGGQADPVLEFDSSGVPVSLRFFPRTVDIEMLRQFAYTFGFSYNTSPSDKNDENGTEYIPDFFAFTNPPQYIIDLVRNAREFRFRAKDANKVETVVTMAVQSVYDPAPGSTDCDMCGGLYITPSKKTYRPHIRIHYDDNICNEIAFFWEKVG